MWSIRGGEQLLGVAIYPHSVPWFSLCRMVGLYPCVCAALNWLHAHRSLRLYALLVPRRSHQALKRAIHTKLGIPAEEIHLSKDAALLTTKDTTAKVGAPRAPLYICVCVS